MTPPTPPPVHPLVAAVLAVTPVHPVRGDVTTGWVYEPDHPAIAAKLVHPWRPEFGDPEPVAARQAVAVLRALADGLDAKADAVSTNSRYRPRLYLDAPRLRDLAAELDPDDPPPPDATADLDPDELEADHG